MAIPFEKLQKLFFEKPYLIKPCEDIETKLSFIIVAALDSPDPVKVIQDNLDRYNRQYHADKMIAFVAKNGKCSTFAATEHLKSKLADKYRKLHH